MFSVAFGALQCKAHLHHFEYFAWLLKYVFNFDTTATESV